MEQEEVNEVVQRMMSVGDFMFPDSSLGEVVNSWDDTFSGLDLLVSKSQKTCLP